MEGLKTTEEKVAYLIRAVPAAKEDYKLLLLLYWQVFDGIEIPTEVVNNILEKGTEPESIGRLKRKAVGINTDAADILERIRRILDDNMEGENENGERND